MDEKKPIFPDPVVERKFRKAREAIMASGCRVTLD